MEATLFLLQSFFFFQNYLREKIRLHPPKALPLPDLGPIFVASREFKKQTRIEDQLDRR